MAKYFLERDNEVLICGRRENRLAEAADGLAGVKTFKCDVTNSGERIALFEYVKNNFPNMNILINNAGVQRNIDLTKGIADFENGDNEICVNFEAPVFLSALFTPFLAGKNNAAIVNVSSGLAFRAEYATGMPIYCATKAALHAFSLAQRKQLEPLGIKVIELIPPAVVSELNTDGGRWKRGEGTDMPSSEAYAASALARMEQGETEIRGI
jgi:uncharacterized oxidoreductase